MNKIIVFFALTIANSSINGMDNMKEKIPASLQKESHLFGKLYELAEENLELRNQLFQSFVEINKKEMFNKDLVKKNDKLLVNSSNSARECQDLRILVQIYYNEAHEARKKNELLQMENCELKKLLEKAASEKK